MPWQEAARIVGEQPDGDYFLDLPAHPALYDTSAPQLASLLRQPRIVVACKQYLEKDRQAIAAQARYKRTMQRANWAILIAASLGALTMAAQIVLGSQSAAPPAPAPQSMASDIRFYVVGALGLASALSGALAGMWLFQVRNGALLDAWMRLRANAETQRLSYFGEIGAAPATAAPDVALDALRLEYFRRYQLDVQRNYYRERGRRHQADADRTLNAGSYAAFLSTLASIGAGVGGAFNGVLTAAGAIGVLAAAVAGFANAREAMSQDRRNAERYDRTGEALDGLYARLDEVRSAVSSGNQKALVEYVAAVNDQISLEHRQWLEGAAATKEAMARLDQALAALNNPRGNTAPRPGP